MKTPQTNDEAKEKLHEEGPLNGDELGNRLFGYIKTFSPTVNNAPSDFNGPNKRSSSKRTVYYLNEHDKEDIVEKWVESNEAVLNYKSEWALYLRICKEYPEFKDAAKDVLGPFNPGSTDGNRKKYGRECPLCGEYLECALSTHLTKCEGK